MLADDDPTIRLLVHATLRNDAYELIEASDGVQALDLAREQMPDLILLDVSMPKLDGLEVCRRLKADPLTRGIKIIMLTARVLDEQSESLGADGYFTKPFSPLALLGKIGDFLG